MEQADAGPDAGRAGGAAFLSDTTYTAISRDSVE